MDSTVSFYTQVARDYPVLSKEEEKALVAKWRNINEDKLRELLILHNLRGALNIGSNYYSCLLPMAEGIQLAVIGLIKAAAAFDLDSGNKFITFAVSYMKTAISRAALKKSNLVHYVSASMDAPVASHHSKSSNDGEKTMGDFLMEKVNVAYKGVSPTNVDQITGIFRSEEGELIRNEVERLHLNGKDKEVFYTYYNLKDGGFVDDEKTTMDAVGRKFGITRDRVRQIISEILAKLYKALNKKFAYEEVVRNHRGKGKWGSKNVISTKRVGKTYIRISGVYRRIEEEQMKSVKHGMPKKKWNRKTVTSRSKCKNYLRLLLKFIR